MAQLLNQSKRRIKVELATDEIASFTLYRGRRETRY